MRNRFFSKSCRYRKRVFRSINHRAHDRRLQRRLIVLFNLCFLSNRSCKVAAIGSSPLSWRQDSSRTPLCSSNNSLRGYVILCRMVMAADVIIIFYSPKHSGHTWRRTISKSSPQKRPAIMTIAERSYLTAWETSTLNKAQTRPRG